MAQEATTKTVTHKDVEYTVPVFPLENLDALEALEDSRYAALVKAVLGPKQYALFRRDNKDSAALFEMVSLILATEDDE